MNSLDSLLFWCSPLWQSKNCRAFLFFLLQQKKRGLGNVKPFFLSPFQQWNFYNGRFFLFLFWQEKGIFCDLKRFFLSPLQKRVFCNLQCLFVSFRRKKGDFFKIVPMFLFLREKGGFAGEGLAFFFAPFWREKRDFPNALMAFPFCLCGDACGSWR